MRMTEESFNSKGSLLGVGGGPQRRQSPVSVPMKNHQANPIEPVGLYSQHHNHQPSLSFHKLQQATQVSTNKHLPRFIPVPAYSYISSCMLVLSCVSLALCILLDSFSN